MREQTELKGVVRRAASGDEKAAADLFDTYHPRVYRYAVAKLGNAADAEDVASETFARLLRDLGRFRWRGAGFEAWLFRIAANLIVDRVRHTSRERVEEDATSIADRHDPASPEERVIAGEQAGALKEMLDRLPPEQREVLLLRFAGGLDTNEAGAAMGKKANAVRQLQWRALEGLREMMRTEAAL
jgi:RNA polymerase sigma-70 factor (ECF subfamily)